MTILKNFENKNNIEPAPLTPTPKNITKSYGDYLQNTQHMVLRNPPSLSKAKERLACLNNDRGVQLGTLT